VRTRGASCLPDDRHPRTGPRRPHRPHCSARGTGSDPSTRGGWPPTTRRSASACGTRGAVAPGIGADLVCWTTCGSSASPPSSSGTLAAETGVRRSSSGGRAPSATRSTSSGWRNGHPHPAVGRRAGVIEARKGVSSRGSALRSRRLAPTAAARAMSTRYPSHLRDLAAQVFGKFGRASSPASPKRGAIASTISHDRTPSSSWVLTTPPTSGRQAAQQNREDWSQRSGRQLVELAPPDRGAHERPSGGRRRSGGGRLRRFNASEGLSNTQPLMTLSFMACR
jgi:hypothetical protein